MNFTFNTEINYFNEALLLSTHIYNNSEEKDSDLPINYNKIGISKDMANEKNQEFTMFLKSIRFESRKLSKKFLGINILFQGSDTNKTPEVFYFLTYSKLKQSIQYYSHEELLDKIKKDFIKNMGALGFDLTENFSFEEIDNLSLFSEQKRYAIYKLVHNINGFFDNVYEFILNLESIIKNHEYIIAENLKKLSLQLENVNILNIDTEANINSIINSAKIDYVEITIFIQFPELFGFSLVFNTENEKNGFLFLGAISFLLHNEPRSVSAKKDDMINKFALLSDATRFGIMVLLSEKPMFGREISEKLSVSTGTISYHLSNLLEEKMINSEIRGKRIYYRTNSLELNRMGLFLKQLGGNKHDE